MKMTLFLTFGVLCALAVAAADCSSTSDAPPADPCVAPDAGSAPGLPLELTASDQTMGADLCNPAYANTELDPCLAYGLACNISQKPYGLGTQCGPPRSGDLCSRRFAVACPEGHACIAEQNDTPEGYGRCLRPCESAADCPLPFQACTRSLPDRCATSYCMVNRCSAPYGACDAAGAGDGTCVPYGTFQWETGTYLKGTNYCLVPGSAQLDEPCSWDISMGDGGVSAPRCAQGLTCSWLSRRCRPICDPEGNAGSLAAECSGVCFSKSSYASYNALERFGGFGACVKACESTMDCAGSPYVCGNEVDGQSAQGCAFLP